MRIVIITSCTGKKKVTNDRGLSKVDFSLGATHLKSREGELKKYLIPARDMYSGQQHVRLMRGIEEVESKIDIDLYIVSAGYGLVGASRKLAPYECTFTGQGKDDLTDWALRLKIPQDLRKVVHQPYDLGIFLLGENYLAACQLDTDTKFGGPSIVLCGRIAAKKLPLSERLIAISLSNPEAKAFSCGLVGLKGEITSKLLRGIASSQLNIKQITTPSVDVLSLLDNGSITKTKRPKSRINPAVDHVINPPEAWFNKPHKEKLRYFIPEWDDLVDPDYSFETDSHSGGTGNWSNEVYAHQLFPEPSYDGILVSRAVAEKSKKKTKRINEMGVHRFLRVPRTYPIMGDCGAFDYIDKDEPPYTTDDVIDYYTRLDFDYGVSVDHLIVPAFESQKQSRYDLTVHNANEFLTEHRKMGLRWEPIGAAQGWDINSYVKAAKNYISMGFKYIALGGMVRSQTIDIIKTVAAVRAEIPKNIQLHVFGFSRVDAIGELVRAGATSIDSASMLRKAWLGSNQNYYTRSGWYPAIRIPQTNRSFRTKRLVRDGKATMKQLEKLERSCLRGLRAHSASQRKSTASLLNDLVDYDTLVAGERAGTTERILKTLEERPWEKCSCAICRKWGVEVVIFRGNNRNRRRGFHNTQVFYEIMQDVLNGNWDSQSQNPQMNLLQL